MDDKWRIPFTLCLLVPFGIAGWAGYLSGHILPWLIGMWIFGGIVIVVIAGALPWQVAVKLTFLWLPAIWSERVRDFVMED